MTPPYSKPECQCPNCVSIRCKIAELEHEKFELEIKLKREEVYNEYLLTDQSGEH